MSLEARCDSVLSCRRVGRDDWRRFELAFPRYLSVNSISTDLVVLSVRLCSLDQVSILSSSVVLAVKDLVVNIRQKD